MYGYSQLIKLDKFHEIVKKLYLDKKISSEDKDYILACAIVLLRYYEKDKSYKSYLEFAYFIILKYSLIHHDFIPLFDFSVNFGFYPIAKKIYDLELVNDMSFNMVLSSSRLSEFEHNNYIETKEQRRGRKKVLKDDAEEICYIAPTSYGKSSIIVDYIKIYGKKRNKIGIIVPTRSLLMQTYKTIKKIGISRKIIVHDEMYNRENRFIAIFTQERALRLLEKHETEFDLIFIDEAHNMLKNNNRSILLSRAVRMSKAKNSELKVIYLTPLLENSENLKTSIKQTVKSEKIYFNIKEPDIYEFKLSGKTFKYNRFFNNFYQLDYLFNNYLKYIVSNSLENNFIYHRSPKKIEMFTKELANYLDDICLTKKLKEIIELIENYVHKDFYAISYLKKGIVYLHGKLPEIIKEYLESKFNDLDEIRYVVANSVILEGMNLPIDCLFIMNTHALNNKELTNLIGRVNRLNNIFTDSENKLNKLTPKVHFINTEKYNRVNSNMENKINLLRKREFSDKVENPVLTNFDLKKIKDAKKRKKSKQIIELEELVLSQDSNINKVYVYLAKEGFNSIYENIKKVSGIIENRIKTITFSDEISILEKINKILICNIGNIVDYEIKRLEDIKTREFYKYHIENSHKLSLNQNINNMYRYFKRRIKEGDSKFYVGKSFGEIKYDSEVYSKNAREVYIDLERKTNSELINLAIVKLEMENQFVSYKLNKLIVFLYDFDIITEDEYHKYIYGTTNKTKINLARFGLSISLINRLEADKQLKNIYLDKYNNLAANKDFKNYVNKVDDFYRYEIMRNF